MKSYIILCFIIVFSSTMYAQYNIQDTNYINTSILIHLKSDSQIIYNINKYHLDVNHVFFFPKDSIRYIASSSSSSSYNSNTYSSSGKANIGKAIATIISAPFVALGKVLGGFSKSSSSSKLNFVEKDSVKSVIAVYPTTLLKEVLDKEYYGKKAIIYNTLTHNNTLDFDQLDTFRQRTLNEYANKIIALSIFVDDTILLSQLYSKDLFHIDSTLYISSSKINKPLLYAATTNNLKLLQFLINHQVNPFISTPGYKSNFYSLGENSGVHYPSFSSKELNIFKEVDVLNLSRDKEFIKTLKKYRKDYKKK